MDGEMATSAHTLAAVVVNYNYARFLRDAVESVLAQRDRYDEIIIVDDGSTDNSLEVLAPYAGRVTIVKKANGGQLSAVLAGCERCGADYVHVLDADDYVSPDLVANVRPALASSPVKLQFQLAGVDIDGRPLQSVFPKYPYAYSSSQMRSDNLTIGFYLCPPTSGNVYSRDFLLGISPRNVRRDEFVDGPITLAAPYRGEVVSISRPLAFYRLHGKNHSQWDRPALDLLVFEMEWFKRRWADVRTMMNDPSLGRGEHEPLYLRERRLMVAALEGRNNQLRQVAGFIAQVNRTNLPPRQRVLLAAWAVLLMAPSRRIRSHLIASRRSPLNRSRALNRMLNLMLRPLRA